MIIPLYKGKLLNSIKSMYINSLACIRVKGGESEYFRVDNGVRRECIISLWLFNIYMDAVMKEVKMEMGGRGERLSGLFMQITWFCMMSWRKT